MLDHIGIAVTENSPLRKLLGIVQLPVTGKEEVTEQKVMTEWVPLKSEGNIELLTPTADDSPIAKYLEKNQKDGIHHLCFRVTDIAATSEQLSAAGFRLIYDAPKTGAHNMLVNFVHPKTTGGLLIEISQKQ